MTVLEKIKAAEEPQHVGATCPKCEESLGTPGVMMGRGTVNDPTAMGCGFCGHDWKTGDPNEIAAAWFGIASFERGEDAWPTESRLAEQGRMRRQRQLYDDNMAARGRTT